MVSVNLQNISQEVRVICVEPLAVLNMLDHLRHLFDNPLSSLCVNCMPESETVAT